jgi:hypothetical protein
MAAEDLKKEREGRRNWLATITTSNADQVFAKSMAEALFEIRELAEDSLLADRAAIAAGEPAALRSAAAKRRLVELAVRSSNRLQVAARDGFQLAAKVFGGQQDSYLGLTAEEMAAIKQARKETEAAKKKEETAVTTGMQQTSRYRPYRIPGWGSLAMPATGQMMMLPQPMMQQVMATGQSPLSAQAAMSQMMPQIMPQMTGVMMPLGYVLRPAQDEFRVR